MHEKRWGSLGNPLEMGTNIIPYLPRIQTSSVLVRGMNGLGARADLRSCLEWYTNSSNSIPNQNEIAAKRLLKLYLNLLK